MVYKCIIEFIDTVLHTCNNTTKLLFFSDRKARGSIPTNPVLHGPANAEPIKGYQTYNMASGNQRPVNQVGPLLSTYCEFCLMFDVHKTKKFMTYP